MDNCIDLNTGYIKGKTEARNKQSFRQKFNSYKKHPMSLVLFIVTALAALITFSVLIFLIAYILINGVPYLTPDFFSWTSNSENVSCVPAIINTLTMTAVSLVIAVPIGIFAAVYLVEYAPRGNKFVKVIRMAAETLSGIPSIVYGLFGMMFFSSALGMGYSLLSGALTLVIMILPLILRTTEEALQTVPDSYREGSFGLGAGRLRTVFKAVLPSAVPGILAGVILAVGRIVGETAALLYTSGTNNEIAGLTSSGETLALHMYTLSSEGMHTNQAYATAVVLLLVVFVINTLSALAAKKLGKRS